MSKGTILFIFSNVDRTLDGKEIGWYLPEAAHPYYILSPHYTIDSASPLGGAVPVDQDSVKNFTDDESVKFLKTDEKAKHLIAHTKKIKDVNADDYVAIKVVGGHGPMFDLAQDEDLARLLQDFYDKKKLIAAVCHGPAALVKAVKPGTNESILAGIPVTGFSNSEEAQTPYNDFTHTLPFSLEDRLNELSGGHYQKGKEDWGPFFVYGNGVLTGQNPGSAGPYAEKILELLA